MKTEQLTEKKSAHTSGPWHIGVRQPTSDKFIYDACGGEVADCDRRTNFPRENLANARLIAAAPELLAALRAFEQGPPDGDNTDAWFEQYALNLHHAREAIAMATA